MVVLFVVLIGAVVVISIPVAVLYRPDLSRDDLKQYISEASKFVTLPNGATVHYRDEGKIDSSHVLVMIHGGFGSLHNWEGWVQSDALRGNFRLISLDLLGHGLTGAYPDQIYTRITCRDTIQLLMEHLGIKKYAVAGNSWGGGIALELGLAPKEDVIEALILVDAEGIPNGEDGSYDTSLFNSDDSVGPDDPSYAHLSWIEKIGSKFISNVLIKPVLASMIYNKELLTRKFVDYFGTINRHKGNRESQLLMFRQGMYMVQQNGPTDLLPRLGELKMPVLAMQGAQDTLVPPRVSETYCEKIDNCELAIVDEAGHMPMIEKPDETAQMLKEFLISKVGWTTPA